MKYLIILAAALCFGNVNAQTGTKTAMSGEHDCLVTATDKDWAVLKLSSEQMDKVAQIRTEAMRTAGKTAEATATGSAPSPEMQRYEAKLKEVLTPAQYEQWNKWCSTHASTRIGKAGTSKADAQAKETE